jgi:hypothetical protein
MHAKWMHPRLPGALPLPVSPQFSAKSVPIFILLTDSLETFYFRYRSDQGFVFPEVGKLPRLVDLVVHPLSWKIGYFLDHEKSQHIHWRVHPKHSNPAMFLLNTGEGSNAQQCGGPGPYQNLGPSASACMQTTKPTHECPINSAIYTTSQS